MPDTPIGTEQMSCSEEKTTGSVFDSVCIDAARIYDSCGAKDCLSNIPLMFTQDNLNLIENACSVKINRANVITSTVEVEPVAFHRGFYAVDMVFYFVVSCDVYSNAGAIPTTVDGLAMYGKRVVLYGSDGSAKTFSNNSEIVIDSKEIDCNCIDNSTLPKATVQISSPMALSAKLSKGSESSSCYSIPESVRAYFGGDIEYPAETQVLVTLGIFTITQLQRNVQIMIPSYDFCVPRKECNTKTDDPCEVFSKIEFPTESFFPPQVVENDRSKKNFGCECNN